MTVLNPEWLSNCVMERIIVHWTAGTYDISDNDLSHYHFLVDLHGNGHLGDNPVSGNASVGKSGTVTSHTKNLNTGSIGIAVAAMGDAVESPFDSGPWPITEPQWRGLIRALTELAHFYGIPVDYQTILMHGEVQDNCGVQQDGKWDIGRLPFKLELENSSEVGNYMREILSWTLEYYSVST